MNLPKQFSAVLCVWIGLSAAQLQAAEQKAPAEQAAEPVRLPVLTVMADRELRNETVIEPVLERPEKRKALQHQVMRLERDAANHAPNEHLIANVDFIPADPVPDMNSIDPILQQHVLNIAAGLQSSDPRNGIYTLLQPFGLDRNALNVQMSREQINLGVLERNAPKP
ncbi:hypothetical protein [Acinetobacter tianfuensis]|nr:hypothetical protein [Acinetobacter tianfuensis]